MPNFGLIVKHGNESKRIELQCQHQNGVVYVVRAESSWVCSEDILHAHALAGFFRELTDLDDPCIIDAMQRWGIYYRPRPLADPTPDAPAE